MSTRARLCACCLLLIVAACGSGGRTGARRTPHASLEEIPMSALVHDLGDVGCKLHDAEPVEGFDIEQQSECADGSVRLYTFVSARSRDEVVEGIRGLAGEYAIVGDLWVAETRSRPKALLVRSRLGGTIRAGRR